MSEKFNYCEMVAQQSYPKFIWGTNTNGSQDTALGLQPPQLCFCPYVKLHEVSVSVTCCLDRGSGSCMGCEGSKGVRDLWCWHKACLMLAAWPWAWQVCCYSNPPHWITLSMLLSYQYLLLFGYTCVVRSLKLQWKMVFQALAWAWFDPWHCALQSASMWYNRKVLFFLFLPKM